MYRLDIIAGDSYTHIVTLCRWRGLSVRSFNHSVLQTPARPSSSPWRPDNGLVRTPEGVPISPDSAAGSVSAAVHLDRRIMKPTHPVARCAVFCLCLVAVSPSSDVGSATASDYSTQAYIGGLDSGRQTNEVAAVEVKGEDGGPLLVQTWQGQPGRVHGWAMSAPGSLSMFLHAQGGKNNSFGGRCLLWETFVAHDSSQPGKPLAVDLVVAFTGSQTGQPGATGGYPRADGAVGIIVPIPYQGGISTNVSFFGQATLTVSSLRSHRFGMVEGAPLSIVAEFDMNVTTTGALGGDDGITADFDARLFLQPVDPTVTITSASGNPYAIPSSAPVAIKPQAAYQALRLRWPVDHRGWRLVSTTDWTGLLMNTNGCNGDCLAGRWFNVTGASYTNDIVIPVNPNLRSGFYQLVWP